MIEITKEQRLFMAISRGDGPCVSELLEEGADPNARDYGGKTPFMYAAVLGRGAIAIALLEKGADPSVRTPDGFSCLPEAARLDEFPEMLPRLIAAGGGIDDANERGMSPMFEAIDAGNARSVSALLAAGADIEVRLAGGISPLHLAARDSDERGVASLLIAAGADINSRNADGETPLHTAVHTEGCWELLVEAGADLDAANSEGMTPLHYAALSGNDEALVVLAERGADLDARDVDGRSPGDLARSDCSRRLLAEARADREARAFDALTSPCADESAKEARRRRL